MRLMKEPCCTAFPSVSLIGIGASGMSPRVCSYWQWLVLYIPKIPRLEQSRGSKQYIIGPGAIRAATSTGHAVTRAASAQRRYCATRTKTNNRAPPRTASRPRPLRWALRCRVKVKDHVSSIVRSGALRGRCARSGQWRAPTTPAPAPRTQQDLPRPLRRRRRSGWKIAPTLVGHATVPLESLSGLLR